MVQAILAYAIVAAASVWVIWRNLLPKSVRVRISAIWRRGR
jgi:hypothetical protein